MRLFAPAFLLGICSIWWLPNLPNLWVMVGLGCMALGAYVFFKERVSFVLLAGVLGFGWVMGAVYFQKAKELVVPQDGVVRGYVADFPKEYADHVSFMFETRDKGKVQLAWYHSDVQPKAGQVWQLKVRLKRPRGLMNPGGFDYERWLFQHHVCAVGYVQPDVQNRLLQDASMRHPMLFLRQKLLDRVQRLVKGLLFAEFLPAIILCERDHITQEEWRVLEKTGTGHLISIAGLHLGVIFGLIFLLVNFIWRRISYLTLRFPAQQVATVFGLCVAFGYAFLAGFNLPTQRAFIMLSVMGWAALRKRHVLTWHSFCLALFLVLLIQPFSVLSASFWMSFSTVGGIIYALQGYQRRGGLWRHIIGMQCIITLSLIPCSLWFFSQISFISLVANIIAVPWFAFIILPACFFGIFLGHLIWVFVLQNFVWLWSILQYFAGLPFGVWRHVVSHLWVIMVVTAGLLLMQRKRMRYFAVLFFVPLFFVPHKAPQYGEMWFTLLDVGQGLSSLVQTAHHVLVFDTGPKFGTWDAGSAVVLPYLQHENISAIDMLMVSHKDEDHIGGAQSIIENIPVRAIRTSVPQKFPNLGAQYCYQGQHWTWDGVDFHVLWPPVGYYDADNNSSCVLHISTKQRSILLTGDIEQEAEAGILNNMLPRDIQSTLIVAPHHGSHTSSTSDFIHMVAPKYVLFPIGYHNRFHFPSKTIVQRYRKMGVQPYDTATGGAITLRMNQRASKPVLYRISHHHVWAA